LKTPQAPFLFANAGGKGYYRTAYDPSDYSKLLSNVEGGLQPTERISVVGNEFALVRAGKSSVTDFLNLAAAVKDDSSADVISSVASGLQTVYSQIAATDEERRQVAAWVRTTFEPELKKVGMPTEADQPEKRELRASLFGLLGGIGDDPYVINTAKQIANQYLENPNAVDATLAQPALDVAAIHGDAAFFDKLQKTFETSSNPQVAESALRALAMFQDPALEKRGLEYAASGKVRNQDSVIQFVIAMHGRKTQDTAWQYIQTNWPQVKAQITTMMGGYLVGSTGNFCSAEKSSEVTSFFTANKVPAAERALKRAQDQISDCEDLRAAQNPKLKEWLGSQGKTLMSKGL
jgi:aminopeptidase N/puromycin-sensitive aminopeptidase